jgi:hypothetical protein
MEESKNSGGIFVRKPEGERQIGILYLILGIILK